MPTIVTTNCSVSVLCNTKQKTQQELTGCPCIEVKAQSTYGIAAFNVV